MPAPGGSALLRMRGLGDGFARFAGQPAMRRALPSLVLVGATALAVVAWLAFREAPRSALYPGLAEAEKARVLETLTGQGIAATVDRSSGDITVPAADYHRARMALAAQGLPQSVPDADRVLAELPMGASRAVEGARLRQAQELDLARSVSDIAAVVAARVHLALPEKSAFLRDSHPPRASVFVTLAAGRVLDAGQVEAIVHLVSSSVPGMARGDVSVIDQSGRLLSRGAEDADSALSDRQLRHRVEVEALLRQRIESVLMPVVGPGNLSVQVTASMDFTRREITEERVDPDGNALRSEQLSQSETLGTAPGGIPGAVANTPPTEAQLAETAPAAGNGREVQSTSSGSTRNYEVSRTVQSTRPEFGRLTRISAAVVIRAPSPPPGPAPADGAPMAEPAPLLAPALLRDLERLAQTAIGFDAARGDSVTILAQPFAEPLVPTVAGQWNLDWLPGVLRELAFIAVLAIVGLGFVRPMLLRQTAGAANGMPPGVAGPGTVEVAEGDTLETLEARLQDRQRELVEGVLGSQASRGEKQAVLRRLASSDPERIAMVLHRMMKPELDANR